MKKKLFVFLPVLSLILCFSVPSFAAVNWTSMGGPLGEREGVIEDVEVDQNAPQNIYILWKEYDSLLYKNIYSILKSVDSGESWAQIMPADPYPFAEYVDPDFIYFDLMGIEADPDNFNKIYAFGCEQNSNSTLGGVWYSDTGGVNWMRIYGGGVPGARTRVFAIAPSNGNYLYRANSAMSLTMFDADSMDHIMSVSKNAGLTWTDISTPEGLPNGCGINAMTVHPTDENIVAVSCVYPDNGSGKGGIYISRNAGTTFELSYSDFPAEFFHSSVDSPPWIGAISFDPAIPSRMRAFKIGGNVGGAFPLSNWTTAELFSSNDMGDTWSSFEVEEMFKLEPHNANDRPLRVFMVSDPNNFNVMLYAQTKFWRTTDGGNNWSSPITSISNRAIEFASKESGTVWSVYTTTQPLTRLYKSNDLGLNWTEKTQKLLSVPQAESVFVNPKIPGCLFSDVSTLFRSTDYGKSWGSIPSVRSNLTFGAITGEAFSLTRSFGRTLYQSTDNLETWSEIYTLSSTVETFSHITCSQRDPGVLYAFINNRQDDPSCRFVKSVDGGATWSSAIGPTGSAENPSLFRVSPVSPEVMYKFIAKRGVFKTTDEGQSWVDITGGLTQLLTVSAMAVDPKRPNTIYVGTDSNTGRVYVSTEASGAWQLTGINPIDNTNSYPSKIVVDPVRPDRVYALFSPFAGTSPAPVIARYLSPGPGWTKVSGGLDGEYIRAIDIDHKTDVVLYAATDNGVYRGIDYDGMLPPSIESVLPLHPVNLMTANMQIDGNYFIDVTGVSITGPQSKSLAFTPVSYVRTMAVLPPRLLTGIYEVRVTAAGGTSNAGTFEVVGASPDGPTIEAVKFDERTYVGPVDPISRSPVVTARIRDIHGINVNGFKYELSNVDTPDSRPSITIESSAFTSAEGTLGTMEGTLSFLVDPAILSGKWYFTLFARDKATTEVYPEGNAGAWVGTVEVDTSAPKVIGLVMSYPQPYKPVTGVGSEKTLTIAYNLTRDAGVTVFVYDISGRLVLTRKFASGVQGGHAGYNQFQWNGRTDLGNIVGNGIYVVKVVSGNKSLKSGKIVVLD